MDRCDVVIDSALSEPLDGHPRRIQFVGSTLTVTATCWRMAQPRLVTLEVTDTEAGIPVGPCRLTILGEGRLDALAHVVTDDDGRVRLAVPDGVISLLVARADHVVAQTAWLRF